MSLLTEDPWSFGFQAAQAIGAIVTMVAAGYASIMAAKKWKLEIQEAKIRRWEYISSRMQPDDLRHLEKATRVVVDLVRGGEDLDDVLDVVDFRTHQDGALDQHVSPRTHLKRIADFSEDLLDADAFEQRLVMRGLLLKPWKARSTLRRLRRELRRRG